MSLNQSAFSRRRAIRDYKKIHFTAAGRDQLSLVAMLLDGLRETICIAGSDSRHPASMQRKALVKAQRIVTGLHLSLSNRGNNALVTQVAKLCRYMLYRLNRITHRNRQQTLGELLAILQPLSSAFSASAASARSAMSNYYA